MVDKTSNHGLNLYRQGDENWTHAPDMESIEKRLIVRDLEENRDDYIPYVDALFFARDSETWYIGDGTTWNGIRIENFTTTEGVTKTRDHVGPLHQGSYHDTVSPDGGLGVVFTAKNLYIESVVVDSDLSNVSKTDLTIELREYNEGAADPPIVDSTTVTLSGGPERISLGFTVPESGDPNDEYVLARGPVADAEESIPLRRISEDNWGTNGYKHQTYSNINFLRGTHTGTAGDFGAEGYWYYTFDWRIGAEKTRVMSPWSTDVDEIYMRPRDPAEEFDDVSPRAIWFDTS